MAGKANVAGAAKKGSLGKKISWFLVIAAVIVIGYLVYKKMKEKSDLANLVDPVDPTPVRNPGSGGSGSGGSGSGGSGQPETRANSTFPYVPKANEYPMQMNARGPGIGQLQKALGLTVDQKWGPKTETAAIDAFKSRYPGKAVPKPFKISNFTQYDAAIKWLEFH